MVRMITPFSVKKPTAQLQPIPDGNAVEINPIVLMGPMLVARGRGEGFADLRPQPVVEPEVESEGEAPVPKEDGTEQDSSVTVNASPSDSGTNENGKQLTDQTVMSLHPSTQSESPAAPAPVVRAPNLMPPLL